MKRVKPQSYKKARTCGLFFICHKSSVPKEYYAIIRHNFSRVFTGTGIYYHYFAVKQKSITFAAEKLCIPETRDVYSVDRIQKFRYIQVQYRSAYLNIVKPITPFSEMKKVILPLLTALISFSAIAAIDKSLPYEVIGIYDRSGYEIPNYYVILSDNEQAYYNHKTAAMEISSGYVLTLDLYNVASDPVALQPGTYTARKHSEAYAPLQFDVAYSEVAYYQDGKVQSRQNITEPVVVELAESGLYSITVQAKDPVTKEDCRFIFSGRVPLTDSNEKPASFPMLKHDVEYELGGGIAYYQGVSDLSNQGVTYLNLYQGEYDSNGALTGDGVNLAMMIAHKRIAKPADYRVIPGTYTDALTLARDTWYPCREINYPMGDETVSLPFGSFIRIRSNGTYVYGYLKSGTFVVEVDDNGIVNGTLDATTDMGYSVKATFRGSVALNTDNATFKSAVSDLTDDVEMDFSKLDKGRVWHTGLKGGCRTFVVDLGSPAGRDEAINHGGDLLRMEFLSPASDAVIKPGVYTVVTRR